MKILCVDQARNCGWSIFDYDTKSLLKYGVCVFPSDEYDYEQLVVAICECISALMSENGIDAVFAEDIQMQANVSTYKKLAWIQGGMIYAFQEQSFLYDFILPTQWQNYCNARGRTSQEIKMKAKEIANNGKRVSKVLSIQFVKDQFHVETDNDNIADAICIGHYVVNNIKIVGDADRD